ncbi:DUF305 domain-containing protein [Sphingomonas sinipercae]|uniref:DUF305 domain-containing protein n=2 Tax=Sphingomonas sinipercae TaxID=2714944 RepID=A0A6G7ZQI4_9SPHN|nr:DUF305 domain-containing protein [Sphingomonas sinipercae]
MISYSGQHYVIYKQATGPLAALLRPESKRPPSSQSGVGPGAFWRGQEHYHGQPGPEADPATAAMMEAMDAMQADMNGVRMTGDVDRDFVAMMVPHHQSAVAMAQAYLQSGRDPQLRALAQHIVDSQQQEIRQMQSRGAAAGAHAGH